MNINNNHLAAHTSHQSIRVGCVTHEVGLARPQAVVSRLLCQSPIVSQLYLLEGVQFPIRGIPRSVHWLFL